MGQQKFTIDIPMDYDANERFAIGEEIISRIIERSKKGKDKNNEDFPAYSSSYMSSFDFKKSGKGKKPNLTLTGEMLNALEVLDSATGKITIGIPEDDTFNNAKAEGNITGSYGRSSPDPSKARDFMGITDGDLNKILDKFPKATEEDSSATAQFALSYLLATQASEDVTNTFLRFEE